MTRHSCHTCHFSRDITSMSTLSQDIWSGQVLFKSGLTRTQQWLWQVTNMTNVKNMNDMTTARRPWPISILSFIFLRRSTLEAIQCQTSDTRHLSIMGKRGRYIVNSRCLPLLTPALCLPNKITRKTYSWYRCNTQLLISEKGQICASLLFVYRIILGISISCF